MGVKSNEIDSSKLFGFICIFTTAILAPVVTIFTRIMKDIHFSLLMFHYGWIASLSLIIWLVFEHLYILGNPNLANIRFFTYTFNQNIALVIMAGLNALGMNLLTIAAQYEKSSSFIVFIA